MGDRGQVIVLNGAPRSGKSSIVEVIQDTFAGPWVNLGVDVHARSVTPFRYRPGLGLRPGGERPDLEALLPALSAALWDSIAAHSRHGLGVVVDVGMHDAYSSSLGLLPDAARRLAGLPVLVVGVRCPVEVVLRRRAAAAGGREGTYEVRRADGSIPEPVLRWQREVHTPGIYDLEVDTAAMSPVECAQAIRARLNEHPEPSAFARLAALP